MLGVKNKRLRFQKAKKEDRAACRRAAFRGIITYIIIGSDTIDSGKGRTKRMCGGSEVFDGMLASDYTLMK